MRSPPPDRSLRRFSAICRLTGAFRPTVYLAHAYLPAFIKNRLIAQRSIRKRLSVDPAAIRHHVSTASTQLLHAFHGHRAGNWPEYTLKICAHHAFVLGIHGGSIHLVRLSICACDNASRMLLPDGRFVFEVNVMRRNKDKRQDQRDHYVVMEASPRVGPKQIALQCAPNARHALSV